jgi:hypothetical protein
MRKYRLLLPLFILLLIQTACFEIREKITIDKEGAGTYSMIMDFSASKKMFQMMLDLSNTKEGNAVGLEDNPLNGLDTAFTELSIELNQISGISNAVGIKNEEEFLFGIELNYTDIDALNLALNKLDEGNTNPESEPYYIYDKKGRLEKTATFNLQNLTNEMVPKNDGSGNNDMNAQLQTLYNDVTYTMIIQTIDAKIRNYTNEEAELSEDKSTLIFSKTLKELKDIKMDLSNFIRFR